MSLSVDDEVSIKLGWKYSLSSLKLLFLSVTAIINAIFNVSNSEQPSDAKIVARKKSSPHKGKLFKLWLLKKPQGFFHSKTASNLETKQILSDDPYLDESAFK